MQEKEKPKSLTTSIVLQEKDLAMISDLKEVTFLDTTAAILKVALRQYYQTMMLEHNKNKQHG